MASDPIPMDFSSGISRISNLTAESLPHLADHTAAASERPVPSKMLNLYPQDALAKTLLASVEPRLLTTLNTRECSLGTLIHQVRAKLGKIRPASPREATLLQEVQDEIEEMAANRERCEAYRRAALAG